HVSLADVPGVAADESQLLRPGGPAHLAAQLVTAGQGDQLLRGRGGDAGDPVRLARYGDRRRTPRDQDLLADPAEPARVATTDRLRRRPADARRGDAAVSWLALTFVYCIASALIPVVNAEAYVAVAGSQFHGATIWAVAACAAGGQLVGKLAYYYLGHSSLNWRWVRKKTESPKWRERYERWQRRIGHNLWLAGLLLLVSATVGF